MRGAKTARRAARAGTTGRGAAMPSRRARRDSRATTVTVTVVVGALVTVWFLLPDSEHTRRSAEIVALCLVVAAASGRALLGLRSEEEQEQARWSGRRRLGALALVSGAAVIPYLHSLSVGFLSDDFGMLWMARSIGGVGEALRVHALGIFLRPLPMLVWWGGLHAWGGGPLGYHVFNVVLHAVNSLLVYTLARRITGKSYGALAAGLLFALHPLHVEPVVWVCCNSDLLCAFFCLLSLLLLEVHLAADRPRHGWLALAAASACFALALLSKEAALALPGVAALRAALARKDDRWRRAALVAGCYGLVLVGYLGWRMGELGGLGGYRTRFDPWTTVFPSALLRQMVGFFFPLNRGLLGGPGAMLAALVVVMAAGLLWWIRALDRVPARRLLLWLGFFGLMTIPASALAAATPHLEHSRFAYLPTIGLVWLFGDLCEGPRRGRRGRLVLAVATLFAAAALTGWYVIPWREARGTAERVVVATAALLTDLEQREGGRAELYVQGIPDLHKGAQVLRNSLWQAVSMRRNRPSQVRVVSEYGDIPQETMAVTELRTGQYLAAWQESSGEFAILRSGGAIGAADEGGGP